MTSRILIKDDLNPEDSAMLQALYSRSAASVTEHEKKIAETGSGKFMQSFYVNYNHRSIADCGSTTIYFEGISMLAAKAIEDWPLYSGQETSTRYVDMARQPIIDPIGTPESRAVLDRWMDFYTRNQDRVGAHVRAQFPRGADEDEKVYHGAVKARTFDILRGFLPAGITTQCSWHTNLRQASDHLALLVHHPLPEVRDIALRARQELAQKYPSSGFEQTAAGVSAIKSDAAQDAWAARCAALTYSSSTRNLKGILQTSYASIKIDRAALGQYLDLLEARPRGGVIPHILTDLGPCHFAFFLDFGSFRDLQRHRNGVCRMPLLTTEYDFERWYVDRTQMDDMLRTEAIDLIDQQREAIRQLDGTDEEKQYYVALGFKVPCEVTYGLPAAVYTMELRSMRTVHPTLRRAVLEDMVAPLRMFFPEIRLHIDDSLSDWDIRRGKQTITERT